MILLSMVLALAGMGYSDTSRPNIVIILADDLGYGDIGCYGQRRIMTPNIDRLAQQGMRFTQAYAGSTVCAPSRCVLMTGLHTGHCRVRGNGGHTPMAQSLRQEDLTIAKILQKLGYATAAIGKWGLGDMGAAAPGLPWRQGFDYFFGYLNQTHAHNYYPTFLWENDQKVRLRNVVPDERPNGAGVATVRLDYSPDIIAERAISFIRDHKQGPFFLYYAPTIPHANNEAKGAGLEVPDLGPYKDMDWPTAQKAHAAMITRLDLHVGRIVQTLSELGIQDRTVVIFTSDNGPHAEGGNDPNFNDSNGPFRGIKRDLYEGGIRVPFIVAWPGKIDAGTVCQRIVWFADLLPTCAELAGAKIPAGLDGVSILDLLLGKPRADLDNRVLYWEFHERGFARAIRKERWKLVDPGGDRPIELYDIQEDPGETKNLSQRYPDIAIQLQRLMAASRTETPDWPVQSRIGKQDR